MSDSLMATHTLEIAIEGESVTVFVAPDRPAAAKLVREGKVAPGRVLLLEDLQWLKANCSADDARKLLATKLQFNAGRIQAAKEAVVVRLCGWIKRERYNPVAVKGWGRYGDNKPVGMAEGALNPMSSVKPRGPA